MSETPLGLCQCGCGQTTSIAQRKKFGNIPGQPLKYIKNHSPQCHKSRAFYKKQARNRAKLFIIKYLKTHPCIECGEADPVCLDFDHRNPKEKRDSISRLISDIQANNEVLLAEITKCDVRCANCHRKKHNRKYLVSPLESTS